MKGNRAAGNFLSARTKTHADIFFSASLCGTGTWKIYRARKKSVEHKGGTHTRVKVALACLSLMHVARAPFIFDVSARVHRLLFI